MALVSSMTGDTSCLVASFKIGIFCFSLLNLISIDAFQNLEQIGNNPFSTVAPRHSKLQLGHVLSASTTSSETSDVVVGLIPDQKFTRLNQIHETITALRRQIPTLLSVPLTESDVSKIYTSDTRIFVRDGSTNETSFDLVTSREELLAVSQALVLTMTASSQAESFLFSLTRQNQDEPPKSEQSPVECRIGWRNDPTDILNHDYKKIQLQVEWKVKLLPQIFYGGSQGYNGDVSQLRGASLLTMNEDGKVASHEILSVFWNGEYRDAKSIGGFLASIRRTVRASPIIQPFSSASSAIFNQVREEFIQNRMQSSKLYEVPLAPLYIVNGTQKPNETNVHNTSTTGAYVSTQEWALLDESIPLTDSSSGNFFVPGSRSWSVYAHVHQMAKHFAENVIPALSGVQSAPIQLNQPFDSFYFSETARLITLDGSVLLESAQRMTNFYQSLALLRQRSFGTWNLIKLELEEWSAVRNIDDSEENYSLNISVQYRNDIQVPGAASTSIRGTDVFTVTSTVSSSFVNSPNSFCLKIQQVRQKKLSVGDSSNPQDGIWLMRTIATAVESGQIRSVVDGTSFWSDLLRRSTGNRKVSPLDKKFNMPILRRPDAAALNTYRIMETLHRDCVRLAVPSDKYTLPPASDYLSDNIQLNGYLGEVLIRSRESYIQSIGLLISSFKTALRSQRVLSEKEPVARVELTSQGNVKWSLTLWLKLSPVFPGLASVEPGSRVASLMMAFKLEVKSEYAVSDETGLILQHRLIESRINGQLTPGDVVSRWVQQITGLREEDDDGENDWLNTLQDAIKWARSLRSSDLTAKD